MWPKLFSRLLLQHGFMVNYLIANESYKVSDISLTLNNNAPLNEAAITYDSSLAKNDLGIAFIAAKETLNHCL
jgi:dihydroflavonol-4-reductase